MKRKDQVSSEVAPGNADISNNAHHPSAGNQNPIDMPPDFFEFAEKCLVFLDMPKLIGILDVPLKIPVWGRGYDKVDGLVIQEGQIPCIAVN